VNLGHFEVWVDLGVDANELPVSFEIGDALTQITMSHALAQVGPVGLCCGLASPPAIIVGRRPR
jgi:hypothetical protein